MQTELHISITHSKPVAQLAEMVASRAWSIDGVYFAESQPLSPAALAVLIERKRQTDQLGWTPDHDDEHNTCVLAAAAACYAVGIDQHHQLEYSTGHLVWPWPAVEFKPKSAREILVRAAALILAEIERLDRIASPITPAPQPVLF